VARGIAATYPLLAQANRRYARGVRAAERHYYDRRATEYDDWYLSRGLYADLDRPGWKEETRRLEWLVAALPPVRVLDLACGTGFLTRKLRGDVTALDQSEAMLAISRERCPGARLVLADALAPPFADGSFDLVFTAHFYGHLRPDERDRFLYQARRLAPELVVVDSALRPGVEAEGAAERVLGDGSHHLVYKRYLSPEGLADELGGAETLLAGEWYVSVRRDA
jgi:SAM-dependent methyltransferase